MRPIQIGGAHNIHEEIYIQHTIESIIHTQLIIHTPKFWDGNMDPNTIESFLFSQRMMCDILLLKWSYFCGQITCYILTVQNLSTFDFTIAYRV